MTLYTVDFKTNFLVWSAIMWGILCTFSNRTYSESAIFFVNFYTNLKSWGPKESLVQSSYLAKRTGSQQLEVSFLKLVLIFSCFSWWNWGRYSFEKVDFHLCMTLSCIQVLSFPAWPLPIIWNDPHEAGTAACGTSNSCTWNARITYFSYLG